MTTALVLAGNSFIGVHLCHRLRQLGVKVVAAARCAGPDAGLETCDLTVAEEVEHLVGRTRPDWVFQCAGATRATDPHVLYRLHVGGTLDLLNAVRRHVPAAAVVLMGSAAEYGPVPPEKLPVTEDHPAQPLSFFGASKLAQTQAAAAAAAEWQFGILVVRPFNVIGPGLPAHYFAAALAERLYRAKIDGHSGDFPVVNAAATRDFVDVRDVVEAMVGLVTRAVPPPGTVGVYNVASGRETAIGDVAIRLCQLAGGFQMIDAGGGQSRSGISRSCGDARKLHQAIGWTPRIPWEQSVEDLWRAFAAQAGSR
jgi:GDP-4-dehydro-6-deoxy-D-mannose reductase